MPRTENRKRKWEPKRLFQSYKKLKINGEGLVDGETPLFLELPEEIQLHIFGFLNWPYEAIIAREVCRDWWRIIPFDLKEKKLINWERKPLHLQCDIHEAGHARTITTFKCGLLLYHVIQGNASVLKRYYDSRVILREVQLMIGNAIPVEHLSLPVIEWLHLHKGMPITKQMARCLVKYGRPEVAAWLYEGVRVVIMDCNNLPQSSLDKVYYGLKWIVQSNKTALWDRVWAWLWSGSSLIVEKCGVLKEMHLKVFFWKLTKHALKRGFVHSIQELVGILSPKDGGKMPHPPISEEALAFEEANSKGDCTTGACFVSHVSKTMRKAIAGNNATCIETFYRALDEETQCKVMGSLNHGLAAVAVRHNACVSYEWVLKQMPLYYMRAIRKNCGPDLHSVITMVKKHGSECRPLLSTLLLDWDKMARAFNREEVEHQWFRHRIKRLLISRAVYPLLAMLNNNQWINFGTIPLQTTYNILRKKWGRYADVESYERTLNSVCSSHGLEHPETWTIHTDWTTWK